MQLTPDHQTGLRDNVAGAEPVLDVNALKTYFFTRSGAVKAVDGVSFALARGETLAIVGESGCGKSVTALSLMRLIPDPPGRIVGGSISLDGVDVLALNDDEMRAMRGRDISMIFQEPMTSLNPVMTIGRQLGEVLRLHQTLTKSELQNKVTALLSLVRIPEAAQRARQYPHQLSGGMRQRVMIAIALACNPKVLIADEPTTALDVTVQAQILELIVDLQKKLGTAVILITHDLGLVAQTAQRVIVMYAGRKVEEATVERAVRQSPASIHPRPDGLAAAARPAARRDRRDRPPAGNPRHGAAADQSSAGMRLRAALPARRRALRGGESALRGKSRGPLGRMLASRTIQWTRP